MTRALTIIADNEAAILRGCGVAASLISATVFIGIGGGLIVAGIACLGLAGVVARS